MDDTIVIAQTLFSEKTWKEFLDGGKVLHHKNQVKSLEAGTYVLLQGPEGLYGVAQLETFPETKTVCRETSLLDADVYSGEDAKYNKYEIASKMIKIYEPPIPYCEVSVLFGIENQYQNNIAKRGILSFCRLFYKGPNESDVLRRVQCWIKTL